ncbi:transformer-2 protein homolog beta-like isoform X2 [Asterias amurensis]
MSDKEGSRRKTKRSRHRSRSRSQSTSKSRSKSRSRSRHRKSKSYSRSRSRSPIAYRSRSRSRERYSHRRSSYGRDRGSYRRRSPSDNYNRSRYRSPSRSPKRSYGHGGRRNRSTSPLSDRRRHQGNRDNPAENHCIGVFGLSLYTTERDLRDVYASYGPLESCNVVYDHQTGRSRGFAFVTFENVEDSSEAKMRTDGMEIDGRRIRVDFSITKRAHTPTPGIYMGHPT